MLSITRFILRRAGWIAFFGTALALLGSYTTYLLYRNLRTNLQELLPTTARSVIDLDRAGKRLSSVENIVVLVFSSHTGESKRFITDLAAQLDKLRKDTIDGVEYRIDKEIAFFKRRLPLYLDLEDIEKLYDYAKKRIAYEKDILGLHLFDKPELDLEAFKKKYSSKTFDVDRFPDGFYATPDQTKRALIAYMPGEASDIESSFRLKNAIERTVQDLNPKSYAPDLEVKFTGNVQNLIEEHNALVADLKLSTIIVVLLVAGAMLLFYRAFWATQALVFSLFMGTLWTFGVSYFLVGYLNANSAFLASIVIGNGINFGIIFLARYLEERRRKTASTRAIYKSIKATSTATLTAALAAGLSYGSLMLTGFRGFSQFGVIGFVGMVLCWISAYTLLPAYLILLEKWRGLVPRHGFAPNPIFSLKLANLIDRHPKKIFAISMLLFSAAAFTFVFHNPQMIELDMNKLRDRTSMKSGSGYYYRYIAEIFGRNLSPMVILSDSRVQAQQIEKILAEKRKDPQSKIGWIQSLSDFVPSYQEKKIEALKKFKQILTPAVMKNIQPNEKEWATLFYNAGDLVPFTEKDLPPLIIHKFAEADGTVGKSILIDKKVVLADQEENALDTISFIDDIRKAADSVSPDAAIAGQLPVTADMFSAILRDGPRATAFAALAVFLLVAILFQRVRIVLLASFGLWLGVSWLAGLIFGFHLKINFLNFIALPITFGIGVDYAVNVFQRYREEGSGSIVNVIRHSGAAVGLCSFTTVIGYTSLLIAGNQAIKSFGILAVLGEICCVTAAVVSLPAFLRTRESPRSSNEP